MAPLRSIVVTGGASGIGLGITKHFITEENTHISILDINPTTGTLTLDKLRSEFPNAGVSFEECDVSSWESQAAVFEKIYNQQGRIDIVFANAGINERGSLLPSNSESGGPIKPELTTLNVNLIGCIYSVQLGAHYISKNEINGSSRGMIMCTASNAGLYPFPMAPLYAATKHGVVGLVRSLSRTLATKNIRINGLAPAVIGKTVDPHFPIFTKEEQKRTLLLVLICSSQ
ncbi:short chain dehydrogenase/reductase [Penicillium waksmanii]|uniref:short chain dehydrogenase/reductase n=1 Tax=Penicillium waksmanii TaxID=69791 RepID=UPI002549071E|nr:short chain dehydrogenase/reductase [Penicillium waksmanii]KAJ5980540.1 short chain dehydrogenase/reductase [Penicillium waksmanii]